ncbi:MAG: thiolase family protein [Polyangiaceae bacterium]
MSRAVVVDAVRTGITRAFHGELRSTRPDDLAAHGIDALLARHAGVPRELLEDCIVGCAFPEGPQGLNLGKGVAVASSLGESVAGLTISRYCASGLDAIVAAAGRVVSGHAEALIAVGVESVSMTMRTLNSEGLFNPRIEQKSPDTYLRMTGDPSIPLWKRAFRSMGETAERLAERYDVSRADQDAFACISQQRTAAAQRGGRFADELTAFDPRRYAIEGAADAVGVAVTADLCNRPDTTRDVLAGLEPAFRPGGSVTAGNSAPAADGAACALVVSEAIAEKYALPRLGFLRGYAVASCPPGVMGLGPTLAVPKLLARHGLSLEDVDAFEINEAFAAQTVHCLRALRLDIDRVNIEGGAISLGHPFGMTGVRLVGHLLRILRRRGGRFGVVSMCVGGGMGVAALLEAG